MNKIWVAIGCVFIIYLVSFASLPCPTCDCPEKVNYVSVYTAPPALYHPISKCERARDVRGQWNVETFVACAELSPDASDVSILVQLTMDRTDVLVDLVDRWKAPTSAVVYLPDDDFHAAELIKLHQSNENLRKYADLHIVFEISKLPYPANHLRNVALINARTEYVITLDVDFIPNRDMHTQLKKAARELSSEKEVFVIAAFESDTTFPDTKPELLAADNTKVFQVHYYKGTHAHSPTNYKKWYAADSSYETFYEYSYEPYYLIRRKFCPLFDERFVGYGNDKSSHAYELAVAGFKFTVLPDPFIIHKNHPSPAWRSGQGSEEAWKLWMNFVRNMKFKYGKMVEVPEWLKEACNKGDCPQFWLFY
eukprot:Phypoly_transcript_11200.p1 GENE.Phypoly_transcript_11200~~Phypoly_transcript_11200.p1  ORF type:complete len:366 (+),score=38.93 Phypoly_transcript_11200:29-1126(+)